jgi:hypothetical protein
MLRDTAVAKEKGLKFYYRWTGPYLVRSATQGDMSFVVQHPHEDKALFGTTIGMMFGFGRCARSTYDTLPAPPPNSSS